MPRVEGKVVPVTGAAGGTGAAAARRLAQEGALLVLTGADRDGLGACDRRWRYSLTGQPRRLERRNE